jgi:hypothetical protein
LPPLTYYPPETLPAPYDIVWCHFPYVEALDEPAEAEHPVLIKQTFIGEAGPEVDAVYGTSANVRGLEFFEIPDDCRSQCGLSKVTRLDVSRVLRLPWCEEYFEPKGRSSPPTHRMTADAIYEFQVHVAHYQNSR